MCMHPPLPPLFTVPLSPCPQQWTTMLPKSVAKNTVGDSDWQAVTHRHGEKRVKERRGAVETHIKTGRELRKAQSVLFKKWR